MAIRYISPIMLNQLTVIISSVIMQNFSGDEQAVIGTFLETLGSMISSNSVYILYNQGLVENSQNSESQDDDYNDQYDILEKSIKNIQDEIEKIKRENESQK